MSNLVVKISKSSNCRCANARYLLGMSLVQIRNASMPLKPGLLDCHCDVLSIVDLHIGCEFHTSGRYKHMLLTA